ncbi:MAG: CHAD domain-containing protein [Caldilineaceae bacterium]|nr:CHAD domain-containing protein [Caldilineaceae bacterium]MDE0180532.1 CHAD domain-containing protein [Caldilineaceae bacterium]
MSFSLSVEETAEASLRRIVYEQIDGAIAQLGRGDDLNEEIHEARKHFKRIRAVLRLARGALPGKTYRCENAFFRDQGRILSPVRDSAVYLETFDRLHGRHGRHMTGNALTRLRHALEKSHRSLLDGLARDPQQLAAIVDSLEVARSRVDSWRFRATETAPFAPGLQRTYARGRAELRVAIKRPTTENFHAFRKRVKYLWYHMQILRPVWPGPVGALARECDKLGDRLGDEHDLAMLLQSSQLQELQEERGDLADLLNVLADRERSHIRRTASLQAARIYQERPDRFAGRIAAYWHASQRAKILKADFAP